MDVTYNINGSYKPTTKRFADLCGPDFFPTPRWATHALLDNEEFFGDIWECACGSGDMSEVIKSFGYDVYSSDYDKIKFILQLYSGYLLSVGRLDYQKGLLHLLRVYRELDVIGVNYPLVLLGNGPQRRFLENYALQLGMRVYSGSLDDLKPDDVISANVFFFGKVINIDMWLKNARLLLSPSLWEGFPLNIIEALSLECPVIASDCLTGPREILNDLYDGSYVFKPGIKEMELAKYGILAPVPSGNMLRVEDALEREEREWVTAVKYALDNTDKLIDKTRAFKKEMLTFFMPENIFRHWERLLDNYI